MPASSDPPADDASLQVADIAAAFGDGVAALVAELTSGPHPAGLRRPGGDRGR